MHQKKLFEEGEVFRSLLGSIPIHPTLLLKGQLDEVMSLDQIHAYITANPTTELITFETSAHFPHAEEPQKFASEVIRYLNGL